MSDFGYRSKQGEIRRGSRCVFVEGDAHVKGGFCIHKLTAEAVTFTVIGGKDKSETFGLNCETSELAQGRKSEP